MHSEISGGRLMSIRVKKLKVSPSGGSHDTAGSGARPPPSTSQRHYALIVGPGASLLTTVFSLANWK